MTARRRRKREVFSAGTPDTGYFKSEITKKYAPLRGAFSFASFLWASKEKKFNCKEKTDLNI